MFPLIRTCEDILNDINSDPVLKRKFHRWKPEHRELFLDACTGVHGVRVLYDSFFKEVMNPETAPERLISFIEAVLEISIRSIKILANDVTRLADETSLIITDIVVELDNGDIVNVLTSNHYTNTFTAPVSTRRTSWATFPKNFRSLTAIPLNT